MRCWGCRRPRTGGWRVHRRISTSAADGKSGSELGPAASGSRRQFDPTGLPRSDARSRHRRRQRIQQRPQPGCTPVRPCLEVHAPQWIQSPKAASPSGPASPGSSLTSECESKVPTDISVTGRAPTGRGAARAPRSLLAWMTGSGSLPRPPACLPTYPAPVGGGWCHLARIRAHRRIWWEAWEVRALPQVRSRSSLPTTVGSVVGSVVGSGVRKRSGGRIGGWKTPLDALENARRGLENAPGRLGKRSSGVGKRSLTGGVGWES